MKRLSRLTALLLTLAMLLSLVSIAHAEEKQSATAWLLYSPRPKRAWKPRTPKSPVPACTRSGSSSSGRRRRAQFSSTSCWTTRRASSPAIM